MKKLLQKNKKSIGILLLLVILFLVPVLPLFKHGFFLSDDGEWMVIRFSAFYQTLRDGQYPPRFFGTLNHGYGYPIGTFLYPAFLYIATPLKLIGLSFSEAIKGVFILSFVFSGLGTYLWLRRHFSILSAAIGSLIYVYFPYHLYDFYTRGSVGELVAFGVLPCLLLAIDRKQSVLGSFLLGLLILSHNTFALLVFPFLIFYTYLSGKRSSFLVFPFGLLLSAFFWLPSLVELPLTVFAEVPISNWEEYFLTGITFQLIGVIGVLLLGAAGYFLYHKKHTITLFFVGMFFVGMFFAVPLSSFIWQLGFLPKLVQFPWRLLILVVWAGSYLGASLVERWKGKTRGTIAVLVILVLLVSYVPLIQTYKPVTRDESYYFTNGDTTTIHNEYMPKTVRQNPVEQPKEKVVITSGIGKIDTVRNDSYKTSFRFRGDSPASLVINTIYYPGWTATVNGKSTEVSPSPEGYLLVTVPAGVSTVATQFKETPLRIFADILSVIGLLFVIWYGIFRGRFDRKIIRK